jgi:hypothetical protein
MSLVGRTFTVCVLGLVAPGFAYAGEAIDLTPQTKPNSLTHVTIQLDAGGQNIIHDTTGADDKPDDKAPKDTTKEKRLAISVAAKLAYDEIRLGTTGATPGAPLAVRYYDAADAVIKVEDGGRTPKLSDDHRLIVLEQSEHRPMLYSPNSSLSREELDLIDVVGDAFLADRLLPTKPVAQGDSWPTDASVIGPLLTLDTLAACEVQCVLDEYNADFAKIQLAGMAHGTADGAATQQEIRGVFLFDRRQHRVTRINLAIKETRSIGGATPGLDAVAKVQVTINPIAKSTHLSDEVVSHVVGQSHAPANDLQFESPPLGFRLKHDRQWYVTAEGREAITLRRVDNGDLAAQCTLTQLPSKSEGRQTTLEQFQKDVTYSLGKSFGELVSAQQFKNAGGLYCFEVIARGVVQDLPVEWHYYLAAPESGSRVSVVVTIEKPMVERVGTADRELVESLKLFPAMPAAKTASRPVGEFVR